MLRVDQGTWVYPLQVTSRPQYAQMFAASQGVSSVPLSFSQGYSSVVEDFALEDQGSKRGFYQAHLRLSW